MSTNKTTKADDLSTEELERALRQRYGIEEKATDNANLAAVDNASSSSDVASNIFYIIISIAVVGLIILFLMAMNSSSNSGYGSSYSSSSKTDWDAYCRDMFPDNDAVSRSAREGCVNGAKTTDDLIDGKYNK